MGQKFLSRRQANRRIRPHRLPVRHSILMFGMLLIIFSLPATARTDLKLLILLSNDKPSYQTVALEIKQRLQASTTIDATIQVRTVAAWKQQGSVPTRHHAQLAVAVGMKASRALLSYPVGFPVLSVLVPRLSYVALLKQLADNTPDIPEHSALFLDQPIERQLKLTQLLLPGQRHAGVVIAQASQTLKQEINEAAQQAGIKMSIAEVADKQDIVATLTEKLQAIDVLLAVFDPAIIDRQTAKQILYLSYRRRFPVIAYSRALATAGALASVYTTPAQTGHQAADFIEHRLSTPQRHWPASEYPRYFSIACNNTVARYLNLNGVCHQPLQEQLEAEQ